MRIIAAAIALHLLTFASLEAATPWHSKFELPGNGYWPARISVTVENRGDNPAQGEPVALPVGAKPGQAALEGTPVQAIRVCQPDGAEVMFALVDRHGMPIERGVVPPGSTLLLPAVCPARGKGRYYVYFDNPAAGRLADYLHGRLELVNGDVELGADGEPLGWKHDTGDEQHRASWSDESPQSGKRCLKTVVAAGAAPDWIATRQSGVPLRGGARYRFSAWVRADGVRGQAGWYMHLGNAKQSMVVAPMLTAGSGTFDWKQVVHEFTVPAEVDRASLGTVLRGTGTAWFDNARLECLDPSVLAAHAEAPERLTLDRVGHNPSWPDAGQVGDYRAIVNLANYTSEAQKGLTVHVDLAPLNNRMRNKLNNESLLLLAGSKPIACSIDHGMLVFQADLPPKSLVTHTLYYGDQPIAQRGNRTSSAGPAITNLVRNASFEESSPTPSDWRLSTAKEATVVAGVDESGAPGLGHRSAKLAIAKNPSRSWAGWQQSVPVEGGRTYLVGGWLKCRDAEGDVRLHFHLHDAGGRLCREGGMSSVGPGIHGTTDWTYLAKTITLPADAAKLSLHLTFNGSGTVWHDGLIVAPITPATIVATEGRPIAGDSVHAWPVNAVTKVFPDDPPARAPAPAAISLARNESEVLQIALRSGSEASVSVEIDEPIGPNDARLRRPRVEVVGYVPIDYPSNYYEVRELPDWQRKIPTGSPACDGWAGLWPDPLLPQSKVELSANCTQPLWITFRAGASARPGSYRCQLRVKQGDKVLVETPISVRVWDFTLPDQRHVGATYDVRPTPATHWGGNHRQNYEQLCEFMAARRLSADRIHPEPVIEYKNGSVVADFTEFDRAAERYFNQWKMPYSYMPSQFYLFGWGHPPARKFGEEPYAGQPPFAEADRGKLRPEYKQAYQACLKAFWEHVGEKGWQDRFVLYISDEPYDTHAEIRAQMRALCDMIHEVDRRIPIYSSTWKHVPEWDGYLDIWGLGHYGLASPEKLDAIRRGGARIWFTTDGQMCTDTPYCATERLLPHYCFQYHAQCYEFWGVAWLTYNPYQFGWHSFIHQTGEPGKWTWIRYPNGDGFLIYPGKLVNQEQPVSSIRLEQAREGAEDYEYLWLLTERIGKAKASGRSVAKAEAALAQAAKLVTIPNAGGKMTSRLIDDPEAIFRARTQLAEAIVALGAP